MTLTEIQNRFAIKTLVDTFSNLADDKNVAAQLPLFTENARVTTYIGGEVFADVQGRDEIGKVFSGFLAQFDKVYHLNGQLTLDFADENHASGTNYCLVKLTQNTADGVQVQTHSIRYQDRYEQIDGVWHIAQRTAEFMISETATI